MPNKATLDPTALGNAIITLASGGQSKNKEVGSTPTASYMHGFGGLFSTPGVRAPVFSAMGLPVQGLLGRLPAIPSDEDNPLFAILTGQTDNTGTQPTGPCANYPVVGKLKVCRQWMPFGRRGVESPVIDLLKVGRRNDRSEMLDYQLIGNALAAVGQGGRGMIPNQLVKSDILNNEILAKMFEMANGWIFETARDLWTSNHATSDIDFYGMQVLVNGGYKDAIQNIACPRADSLVRPFASASISDATNGDKLVRELTYQVRTVNHRAVSAGLNATWAFVMRGTAFYEVSALWPCSYYTNRCATGTNNTNFTNAVELTEMRDEMRNGNFLWVDGKRIEVIIDDTMPETQTAGGKFVSDIYLIPLTVNNIPATFIEYFDYDGANGPVKVANELVGRFSPVMATDGGKFLLVYKTPTNTCIAYQMIGEYRLILRAPFLAARTTNVGYVPLIHSDEYLPDAPSFYVNGGVTNNNGYGPSYWPPTA